MYASMDEKSFVVHFLCIIFRNVNACSNTRIKIPESFWKKDDISTISRKSQNLIVFVFKYLFFQN